MDRQDFHSHCSHIWARRAHVRGSRFLLGLSTSCTSLGAHRSTPLHTESLPAKPSGSGVGMGRCWVANKVSYSTGEGKRGQARSRVNTCQAELLLWAQLASWQAGTSVVRATFMSCWPCTVLLRDVGHCWTVRMRTSLQAFGSQVEILQFGWQKKCLINSSPPLCTQPWRCQQSVMFSQTPFYAFAQRCSVWANGLCPWSRSPRWGFPNPMSVSGARSPPLPASFPSVLAGGCSWLIQEKPFSGDATVQS